MKVSFILFYLNQTVHLFQLNIVQVTSHFDEILNNPNADSLYVQRNFLRILTYTDEM